MGKVYTWYMAQQKQHNEYDVEGSHHSSHVPAKKKDNRNFRDSRNMSSTSESKETDSRDGHINLINETDENTDIFQSIRYPLGGKASMGRWRACASLIQSTASI